MKKSSRSEKPLCLNNLSGSVLTYIINNPDTSYQKVADAFVQEMNQENEKTTRRRVHDVLNVFSATGLITKDSKMIHYQPIMLNQNEGSKVLRFEEKKKQLIQKINLLIAYQSLIERNKHRSRPSMTLQLPAIIIGFDNRKGTSKGGIDGKTLEIYSSTKPHFFSPMDILKLIPPSKFVLDDFFYKYPAMAIVKKYILQED